MDHHHHLHPERKEQGASSQQVSMAGNLRQGRLGLSHIILSEKREQERKQPEMIVHMMGEVSAFVGRFQSDPPLGQNSD